MLSSHLFLSVGINEMISSGSTFPNTPEVGVNIGLIGYGTIGRVLSKAIEDGKAGPVRLVAVKDMDKEAPFEPTAGGPTYTDDIQAFLATDMQVVVEAASQAVLKEYAHLVLRSRRDLVAMSVGAFSDEVFLRDIMDLSSRCASRLFIPSGAIGGLDVLSAACIDEIHEVTLTTTKPPRALKGVRSTLDPDLDLDTLTEPTCIYDGPAEEAVVRYPKNVNVAAALSMAGVGFTRTMVRIIADPRAQRNMHRIEAKGNFGELTLELKLHPSPSNPKTTYLAALSVVRLVKKLTEQVIVGT
jgi:aspartate dehydrogenase